MRSARACALIGCCLIVCGAARGADLQRIVLRDGSVIVARVRSLADGVYTLESASLGSIEIPQQRVRSIGPPPPAAAPTAPPAAGHPPLRDLQLRMIADPAVLAAVLRLRELPEMQAVLTDPEILAAVARGDLAALEKHPKIRKLMEASAVQDLTARITPAP